MVKPLQLLRFPVLVEKSVQIRNRKSGPTRKIFKGHCKCTPEILIFGGWKAKPKGPRIPVKPRQSKHAAAEFAGVRSELAGIHHRTPEKAARRCN